MKIINRPIYVQKVYKVDNWKGGRFDNNGPNRGIKIYAPRFSKDDMPNHGPKKFADNPKDFRPKAKLKDTYKGDVPRGWGPSAKGMTPIAKEDPDAFKKKYDFDRHDQEFGDRGGKDNNRDQKIATGITTKVRPKAPCPQSTRSFGSRTRAARKRPRAPIPILMPATPNSGIGTTATTTRARQRALAKATKAAPTNSSKATATRATRATREVAARASRRASAAPGGPGGPNQFKQGNREQDNQSGGQGKHKGFDGQGGPGGPGGIQPVQARQPRSE